MRTDRSTRFVDVRREDFNGLRSYILVDLFRIRWLLTDFKAVANNDGCSPEVCRILADASRADAMDVEGDDNDTEGGRGKKRARIDPPPPSAGEPTLATLSSTPPATTTARTADVVVTSPPASPSGSFQPLTPPSRHEERREERRESRAREAGRCPPRHTDNRSCRDRRNRWGGHPS